MAPLYSRINLLLRASFYIDEVKLSIENGEDLVEDGSIWGDQLLPLLGGSQLPEVLGDTNECSILQWFFIQKISNAQDLDAVVRRQFTKELGFAEVGQTLDGVHVGKAKQIWRALLISRQLGQVDEGDHVGDGIGVEALDLERVVRVLAPFFGREQRFPDVRLVRYYALVAREGRVLADDLEIGKIRIEHHFLQRVLTNFRAGTLKLLHV